MTNAITKRRNPRRARRLQVQFWRPGELQTFPGYTTNLSLTGMFLATNSPQPPGTRLRIEILDGTRGFLFEAVVAHARKVRSDLARMTQPGMGIRFLKVEELVRELIPDAVGEDEAIPDEPAPEPAAEPVPPSLAHPPSAAEPLSHTRPAAPVPVDAGGVFSVQFLGAKDFLEVYHRDIVNGGLFVSTRYPGRLQEVIQVQLHPPLPGAEPLTVRARVVQRFEPQGDGGLLSGMGVELLELPRILEGLRSVVAALSS